MPSSKSGVVGTNDKGQFVVNVPRSQVERVDVIDIDLAIKTKGGELLILPGAAMEALTSAPPTVNFADGPVGAGDLLSQVDKVTTPPSSIPAMTSLTEFDQKRTAGKKNLTQDGQAAEAAQQAQANQVAPLPTQGNQSAVDKLVERAEAMEADMRRKAFDPAPPQVYDPPPGGPANPPNPPPSFKIPMYVSLAEGNVVNTTDNHVGNIFYGSGGPAGSALASGILAGDALQYGTEVLTGTAASETFYADAFYKGTGTWVTTGSNLLNNAATYAVLDAETGLPTTGALYYAKEIQLNVAGYVRSASSVTISGLPDGVSIEGATQTGPGTWSVSVGNVFPNASTMVLVYDITKVRTLGDVEMSVNIVGFSTEAFNITRKFILRFAEVDEVADVTGAPPKFINGSGGGWSDIFVMPTASAPHSIAAGEGDNLVYAGNSADTITAGSGNDTIYAFAGNDTINAGDGNNIIWAGNGSDRVTTGSGNDIIQAGASETDTGGTTNIVWAGDGKNTIVAGGGADTLIGGAGIDHITAGAGNDMVFGGGGGNNAVNGGTLDGGAGTDWLSFNGIDQSTVMAGTATLENWLKYAGSTVSVSFTADGSGSGQVTKSDGTTDDISNFENLIGGHGNDTLSMANYVGVAHTIYGLDGNDIIVGADMDDVLYGGAGNDSIQGRGGNDVIYTAITGVNGAKVTGTNEDAGVGTTPGTLSVTAATGGAGTTFTGLSNVVDGGAGADTVVGGDGDDYFIATMGESTDGTALDTFTGGSGTDTLDLSSYNVNLSVTLSAIDGSVQQTGTTTYFARFSGIERLVTGSGNDSVTGSAGNDIIYTGLGNDVISAKAGNDTVYAGDGNDTIYAEGGNDVLYGEGNDDTLYSYGASGLLASSATITLDGGAGSNTFLLYGAKEIIQATSGTTDHVSYWNGYGSYGVSSGTLSVNPGTGNVNVALGIFANLSTTDYRLDQGGRLMTDAGSSYWWTGIGTGATRWSVMGAGNNGYQWSADNDQRGFYGNAQGDEYYGVENITGTNYADVLIGSSANNVINGNGGNDALYGLAGDDYFTYGGGNVFIDGGGNYTGGGGVGTAVTMTASGVTGGDTLDLNAQTVALNVTLVADGTTNPDSSLTTGSVTNGTNTITFLGIENFIAGSGDDIIRGSDDGNYIVGGIGNDTIYGNGGDDVINLGQNRQSLTDVGADSANGGLGTDWVSYNGIASYNNAAGVDIHLEAARAGAGTDANTGTAWNQYARITIGAGSYRYADLTGFENAQGSGYADTITGSSGDNVLWGMGGNDTLYGGAGNDTLDGGAGNDRLEGGLGDDVYYVEGTGDVVVELAGGGSDTVYTTGNYTLTANVETLIGSGTGNITLAGTSAAETITGNSGNNVINGNGGADVLSGGGGNDTFNLSITQLAAAARIDGGTGTDTLVSANFTLNDTFADAKYESIEAINVRGGTNITTSALDYTKLADILDVADGGTLTLYLDSGDTFTHTGSTLGAGTARTPGTTTTYDYTSGANTLHVQVQWS